MKNKLTMITAMLIFGSIGVFVRHIELTSTQIACLRAVIASVFLLAVTLWRKERAPLEAVKRNALLLILSGAAIGANWIFLFQAYKYTTISNATLSYYFAPVFVAMLSPVVLKEKLSVGKVLCILAAMAGLFLILNGQSGKADGTYQHIKGIGFGLLGAMLYASVVLMNKFIKNLPGFETTLVQLGTAALVLLPVTFLQGGFQVSLITPFSWGLILVLGVLHTGIAYVLYFTSIKEMKGQSIAILSYIDPISAVLFAAIFLQESMNLHQVMGGLLILGSTYFGEKELSIFSRLKGALKGKA